MCDLCFGGFICLSNVVLDMVVWDPTIGLYQSKPGFEWDTYCPLESEVTELLDELKRAIHPILYVHSRLPPEHDANPGGP